MAKRRKTLKSLDFQRFLFLSKSRNTEKYYGRLWVMCEWSQLWAIPLTVDYSWLWADWNTRCYHHIHVHKVGFSAWERTFDPVWVAIPEFSKHTLTLERFINTVSGANTSLNIDFCVFQHYLPWVKIHSRVWWYDRIITRAHTHTSTDFIVLMCRKKWLYLYNWKRRVSLTPSGTRDLTPRA